MFPVSYSPHRSFFGPSYFTFSFLTVWLLAPKRDRNKVSSLGGNPIHSETGHPAQGRSGADTRSQEQEARSVDSSLGLKLGFGLTLGSEMDGQAGLEQGSGHGPSQGRY